MTISSSTQQRARVILSLLPLAAVCLTTTASANLYILDFEDFTPGSVITSQVSGEFSITTAEPPPGFPIPVNIEVNPGAPSCSPGPCDSNGTTSLWTNFGSPVLVEHVDGTPFTPVSASMVSPPDGNCAYDGVTESGTALGTQILPCSQLSFGTASFPDHGPLLSFGVWSLGDSMQLDDLVVDIGGTPPPPPVPAHVTLVSDSRSVSASGTNEIYDEYFEVIGCTAIESDSDSPSPDFADFSGSASAGSGGYGNQSTIVTTSGFSGSGSASGFSDYCWGFGYSIFRVSFHVDTPVEVQFSGDLGASGYTLAQARLQKDATNVFLAETWDAPLPFDHQSILLPGDYTLTVQADGGNAWVDANYDFTVEFFEAPAVIPLLAPLARVLLVVLLAAGLLAQRRLG